MPEKETLVSPLSAHSVADWLGHRSFRDPPEFVESIPFRETRLYVEAVMRDEVVYRRLLSGSPRFLKCD